MQLEAENEHICDHNYYSGVHDDLNQIGRSLELYGNFTMEHNTPDLGHNNIIFGELKALLSNSTTSLQKQTALRVVKRFLQNQDMADKGCQVEMYDESVDILKFQKKIDIL